MITMPPRTKPVVRICIPLVAALIGTAVATLIPKPAGASLSGASVQLARAPYLTDLTTSSVQITWATSSQVTGLVRYGPLGNCSANSVASTGSGSPITVTASGVSPVVKDYQLRITLTGLSAGSTYCYRVYTGGASPVDLLGTSATPQFGTLTAAGSTSPFTFDVFGDWGDTTNSGVNTGDLNANQAGVDAQLAASGAQFALSTGDIAYPGGTQATYGDLNLTGVNQSAIFGPSYWAAPGQVLPMYTISANHGRNATFLNNWPQDTIAASGVYGMVPYPSIDGATAGSFPTSYYAFDVGTIRIYMLDASWSDSNVGTATGGTCGSHCAVYQVDHDSHWLTSSAEYRWLAADLAAHPGGVKIAAFHFPLRSDDATEPNNPYADYTPGSTNTLEGLLHNNGVSLVFNGHAHIYQRNVPPPGGVVSYVSGGGGAKLTPVSHCSTTDAYAIGWSYSSAKGSVCGAAVGKTPTSDAHVFHYLKVRVAGTSVTVTPIDSTGQSFDQQTYDFAADTTAPTSPGALKATVSSSKTTLTWTAAADDTQLLAYDIYRNGVFLATVTGLTLSYADSTAVAGTNYTYRVDARDLAGNTTGSGVTVGSGGADTVAPSTPTSVTATSLGLTSIKLTWAASTDNVGVTSYTVKRSGAPLASVSSGTSFTDTGLQPGTQYSYTVTALDAAGNASPVSAVATTTTDADTTAPTAPGGPTASGVTGTSVTLNWIAATDNVGVLRYDVTRDGVVVGESTTTSYLDSSVAASTTYSYAVIAYDAAGHATTGPSTVVVTPAANSVFADGFESNNFDAWTSNTGFSTQQAVTHDGSFAAREISTGTATYAYAILPGGNTELWARAWVYVVGRSTSANLFGFRTSSGASIVNVYLDSTGRLSVRNNIGGVTTYSTTVPTNGAWHLITMHTSVGSTSGTVDVTLDGSAVTALSLRNQDLGAAAIAKLQLGETATGRTYDIALDNVQVSSSSL